MCSVCGPLSNITFPPFGLLLWVVARMHVRTEVVCARAREAHARSAHARVNQTYFILLSSLFVVLFVLPLQQLQLLLRLLQLLQRLSSLVQYLLYMAYICIYIYIYIDWLWVLQMDARLYMRLFRVIFGGSEKTVHK